MSAPSSPVRDSDDGISVMLRVTPKASRNAVIGIDRTGESAWALKVMVTTAPEQGKANAAVIKLLARAWKVPKGAITVASGETSRNKTLRVHCDGDTRQRIRDWFEGYRT